MGKLSLPSALKPLVDLLRPSLSRLELSLAPSVTLKRLRLHKFTLRHDGHYLGLFALACLNLACLPSTFLKLFLPSVYALALLLPLTSQFVLPATPVFSWLLLYFSSRYIPTHVRPHIWITVLPTLESVLYGANISDILTRYTHPFLDILAWLPYGLLHFSLPFVVAALIFVFGPPGAVKHFGKIFGYLNILGVACQILFPCSPPWYELIYGLTPANYGMKGSAGGLARIDALFGSNGYQVTFENAPVPFGAFPSLHAGCSTMDALFLAHFFPRYRAAYFVYVLVLFWSTMYLSHHYLIDLVAGSSLAILTFYLLMNDEMRAMAPAQTASFSAAHGNGTLGFAKDLETPASAYGRANGFAHPAETDDELEASGRAALLSQAGSAQSMSRRNSRTEK